MSKFRIRFILLALTWGTIVTLYITGFAPSHTFFVLWIGVCASMAIFMFTHLDSKKLRLGISDELQNLKYNLIDIRPLTIFEMAQFADTRPYFQIILHHYKRIVTVERDGETTKLCIRITKIILSNSIERIEIIGEV